VEAFAMNRQGGTRFHMEEEKNNVRNKSDIVAASASERERYCVMAKKDIGG